jgi:hypothetical protein
MQRGVGTLSAANSMLEQFHDTVRGGLAELAEHADSARERFARPTQPVKFFFFDSTH